MGEEVKNLGYSEAQILGTIEKVEDLQVTERAALMQGNLGIDTMHQKLLAQHRKANASNEKQEQKKRELREITEEHEADLKQLYVIGSSQLDMMIGAVDKNSISAKNFRRIRSRMKRPDNEAGVEPAQNLVAKPAPGKP